MFFQMTFSLASQSSSSPSLLKLPTTKGQHKGCETGPTIYGQCTRRLESLISQCGYLLLGSTLFFVIFKTQSVAISPGGLWKTWPPTQQCMVIEKRWWQMAYSCSSLASCEFYCCVLIKPEKKILTVIRGVNFCSEEDIVFSWRYHKFLKTNCVIISAAKRMVTNLLFAGGNYLVHFATGFRPTHDMKRLVLQLCGWVEPLKANFECFFCNYKPLQPTQFMDSWQTLWKSDDFESKNDLRNAKFHF